LASDILDKLINGVRIGRQPADRILVCPNWPSANVYASRVNDIIHCDLASGRLYGPFTEPPFQFYISSPLGAFIKRNSDKIRLIHDLSFPALGSVNGDIDPEQFSLHYSSVDDAAALCLQHAAPWLAKLDLKDAYKHVLVHPDDWHLLGFHWGHRDGAPLLYFSKVLNFGLRSAPALFDIFAGYLQRFMAREGVEADLVRYVDDFLLISPTQDECARDLHVMLDTCDASGFAVQPSKVTDPTRVIEILGIIIDVNLWELRISEDRVAEIRQLLSSWLGRRTCSKRELLSLIGKIAFSAKVVKSGRAFLGRLIYLARKAKHLHFRVRLSREAMRDIEWWSKCLETHNGVYFFRPDWHSQEVVHIFTDASDHGFGGVCQSSWFAMAYT